jgi:hypothetical protein
VEIRKTEDEWAPLYAQNERALNEVRYDDAERTVAVMVMRALDISVLVGFAHCATPAFAALRPIRPLFSSSFISLLRCCGLIMPAAGRSATRNAQSPTHNGGFITVANGEL